MQKYIFSVNYKNTEIPPVVQTHLNLKKSEDLYEEWHIISGHVMQSPLGNLSTTHGEHGDHP